MKKILIILIISLILLSGCIQKDIGTQEEKKIFNKVLDKHNCLRTDIKIIERGGILGETYPITGVSYNYPCKFSDSHYIKANKLENEEIVCLTFNINKSTNEKADNYLYSRKCNIGFLGKIELEIKPQIGIFIG